MNVGSMRQGILAYPLLIPDRPLLIPDRPLLIPDRPLLIPDRPFLIPGLTRNLMRSRVKPAMRARGARDEGKRGSR